MARLCERPGCSAPAACVYGIDSRRLSVWIDGTVPADAGSSTLGKRAGVLCRRHADSMVVPIGWTLDDRRSGSSAASDQGRPAPLPRVVGRRPRRATEADSEQLALLEVPADEPPAGEPDASLGGPPAELPTEALTERPTAVSAVVSTPAALADTATVPPVETPVASDADGAQQAASPWRPVFDQTDDLGGLLATRSPLLARAFGKRNRAQSSDEHGDR